MNKNDFFFGVDTCYKCNDRKVGCHSTCEKYILGCEQKDEKVKKFKETAKSSRCSKPIKGSRVDRYFLQT